MTRETLGYIVSIMIIIGSIYSIYNYIQVNKYYGKKVHIKPEADSLIRYGYIVKKKGRKFIVSVFNYGLRYEKEYDKNMLIFE